jgi:hypothetical protein
MRIFNQMNFSENQTEQHSENPFALRWGRFIEGKTFSTRMFGFALFRAWMYLSFFQSHMLVATEEPGRILNLLWAASLIALALTLLVCAAFRKHIAKYLWTNVTKLFPAAFSILGTTLIPFINADTYVGIAAFVLSGVFTGFGSGLLLLGWGMSYGNAGGPTAAAETPFALFFAALSLPLFTFFNLTTQIIIISLLPVISSLLLFKIVLKKWNGRETVQSDNLWVLSSKLIDTSVS